MEYTIGIFLLFVVCPAVAVILITLWVVRDSKKYQSEQNAFSGSSQRVSVLDSERTDTLKAKHFDAMSGAEFEVFCATVLSCNGFENVEITGRSGDQGIDIVATKGVVKYGFQCKRYSSNIGNGAVREVYAGKAFYCCDVAVIVTNRYFTPAAQEAATRLGVFLWDREKLLKLVNAENKKNLKTP